ncbi:TPR-like protein [Mycena epipterygia]|nr:TPR-like protein [Mycena epipterygia]
MFEEAVRLTPEGHCDKPSRLNSLGNLLLERFERVGGLDDINKSVEIFENAVGLILDGEPNKPMMLSNLGNALSRRFERLGELSDITKSMLMGERAVGLTLDGDPAKPFRLNNLGTALLRRFNRLGDLSYINKSVLILEDAARLTTDHDPEKPLRLSNLGTSLLRRFSQLSDVHDINKSVLMFEHAVELTPNGHPDKPLRLNNLGASLLHRFSQLGDLYDINSDLNKSVLMSEAAVNLTPEGHPDKFSMLSQLGNSLCRRFERLGKLHDINKCMLMLEDAVTAIPDNHPDKPLRLSTLGSALFHRFNRLGDLRDINKSISMFEGAILLIPQNHPGKPLLMSNLGICLSRRFEELGDLSDINKSVRLLEDAVTLSPEGHPQKPSRLSNLGSCLMRHFERLDNLNNLNKAILMFEAAIALIPANHPEKSSLLSNLSTCLQFRFKKHGDLSDIDKSVMMSEAVVALVPQGHPDRPSVLSNLGISLSTRFHQCDELSDINNAILKFKEAIELTPDGHPQKPSHLNNLGGSFFLRFQQGQDADDLEQSIVHYTSAACSTAGPANLRFHACTMWAQHAQASHHPSLLHAYSVAIDLLPQIAWLGLSISDRHHHIMNAGPITRNAVAAAIDAAQYDKAVAWLEQGRSVVWGQLLNLRTPVDDLKHSHPDLADQLMFLSTLLEGAGSLQSIAQRYHDHACDRDELLKKIRGLEGFHSFLLPNTIVEFFPAARAGPVIIVNISAIRCDALVLRAGFVIHHIPLTDFTLDDAQHLGRSLEHLMSYTGRNERLSIKREGQKLPEEEFKHILSQLWWRLAKPVLDALAITTPLKENLQRIWWCLTGPLAFLPIHAAGLYDENETFGSKLSDFVISSYTPSLTALIQGFRPVLESQDELQLLAVAQPSASGQSFLPGTQEELNLVQLHASGKLPVLRLEEHAATVENVQEGMKKSSWVHFACHGIQDITNPTESALLLAGSSRLTLLSIIKLSLPNADFAFLSACQTATGAKDLQEESVHLAAGMLLAGYRGVVATMWSIMDNDAPHIAGNVYQHLFQTSPPDPTRAAEALHLAVQRLQESSGGKKSFFHWVPFIHIGV